MVFFVGLLMLVVGSILGAVFAYAGASVSYRSQLRAQRLELDALRGRELPPRVLEVWLHEQNRGPAVRYIRSVDADRVAEALHLVARGLRSFSVRGLAGVLTRSEFESVRADLIAAGLLTWSGSDRRQGVAWTDHGRAVLDAMAIAA